MEVQLINDEFSRLASSNERPEVERPKMDADGPVHDGEWEYENEGATGHINMKSLELRMNSGVAIVR